MDKNQEMVRLLKDSKDSFLMRQELLEHVAMLMKEKYDALTLAGFTESQAIELIKGGL